MSLNALTPHTEGPIQLTLECSYSRQNVCLSKAHCAKGPGLLTSQPRHMCKPLLSLVLMCSLRWFEGLLYCGCRHSSHSTQNKMPLADSDEPSRARMHTSLRHCGKEPADGVHQERPELREPSRDMVTTVTSGAKDERACSSHQSTVP